MWWNESLDPILNPEAPILFVLGMNPGYHEDKQNEPFVGPAGQLLRGPYLKGTSLHTLATIYLTNSVRCCSSNSNPPKRRHLKTCFEHTIVDANNIVREQRDKKIAWLCCGAAAIDTLSRTFFPKRINLSQSVRSQSLPFPFVGRNAKGEVEPTTRTHHLFTTYHPAAVLRNSNLIHPVSDHLTLLSSFFKGTIPTPTKPTLIKVRPPRTL